MFFYQSILLFCPLVGVCLLATVLFIFCDTRLFLSPRNVLLFEAALVVSALVGIGLFIASIRTQWWHDGDVRVIYTLNRVFLIHLAAVVTALIYLFRKGLRWSIGYRFALSSDSLGVCAFVISFLAYFYEFTGPPTTYAPGYSRAEFLKTTEGTNRDDVLTSLGPPLWEGFVVYKQYIYDDSTEEFKFHYYTEDLDEFKSMMEDLRIPPGEGDERETLAKRGAPDKVELIYANSRMQYSWSATGSDYWQRVVFLDGETLTVEGKIDEYYFD